jgi:phytol kinase
MVNRAEVGRQIMHAGIGVLLAAMYYFDILSSLAVFLGIIIGVLISFICKRVDNFPVFSWFLKHYEREEEKKSFPGKGLIFYFVGILLVMQLFEKNIALAAILILALGDSVSHLYGASVGKIRNIFNGDGKKLLEGTLAGTVAGALGAMLFIPIPEAVIGSFAAMMFEVVKIDFNDKTLDDNIVVPLVAGTVIFLLRTYL